MIGSALNIGAKLKHHSTELSKGRRSKSQDCVSTHMHDQTTMTGLRFHVQGWQAWTPGRDTPAAWSAWAEERDTTPTSEEPSPASPPLMLRRRIGTLGQRALKAAWGLPGSEDCRYVFASRHGEFDRTLSILRGLAVGEDVTPSDFMLSVHHALAGLLSIVQKNRRGHTAVAAGDESFGAGLLEAAICLSETPTEPVLLVYYDEPLPAPFYDLAKLPPAPIALALLLTADGPDTPLVMRTGPSDGSPASKIMALDFLKFLLSGAPEGHSQGERLSWQWSRS